MKNKKTLIIIIVLALLIILSLILVLTKPKKQVKEKPKQPKTKEKLDKKVDIIDLNSKTRPLSVSINNTPVAVKAQTGLNKAYLIYEIPTEGSTSRLLAFFKDVPNTKIGTIRSARHNMIDYSLESDAIFASYGWSHYAEDELKTNIIDYVQGIKGEGDMYRENPLNLAREHTVYGETNKILNYAYNKKNYKKQSDNTILLNYRPTDVYLGGEKANTVTIYYGNITTKFIYDKNKKNYIRNVNNINTKDLFTNEEFTTKNIIIQKITYKMCDDNYYWDLNTVSSGDGYYITNGSYIPIKWTKESRSAKTIYKDLKGNEINMSDGRTYIELTVRDINIQ